MPDQTAQSVAVWRSQLLPRGAGATWIASAVLLYAAGLVVGLLFTHNSPPTEPIGAAAVAAGGAWMAISARRRGRGATIGASMSVAADR